MTGNLARSMAVVTAAAALVTPTLLVSPPAMAVSGVDFPPSIATDCSQDVSSALQAFLQGLPDGSQLTLPADACLRVETEVQVRDKTGLVINGNGATLKRTQPTPPALQYPHANAFLRLINWTSSSVTGLHIVGINTTPDVAYLPAGFGAYDPRYPFDHGIAVEGAQGLTISDSTIRSVYGDGIYITGADQWTPRRSDTVTVRDVTVDQNGRQGMSISRSSHVLIDGAQILHSRRSGIDLEPDSPAEVISNVEIEHSTIGSNLLAFASGGPGAVNDIDIHDNRVTRSGVPFVYDRSTLGVHRSNWRVADNTVLATLGSPQPAMLFAATDRVTVTGNSIPVATTQSRLEVGLVGATRVTIACNRFPGAADTFVAADSASTFSADSNSTSATAPTCPTAGSAPGSWWATRPHRVPSATAKLIARATAHRYVWRPAHQAADLVLPSKATRASAWWGGRYFL